MDYAQSYLQLEANKVHPNYGYTRTASCKNPKENARDIVPAILAADKKQDTILWGFLFAVWPTWCYGLQGTGDCVSWGTAHMLDCTMAYFIANNKSAKVPALQCSESIYGFGKTELFNNYNRHYPGMSGIDAVNAVTKFGTLYRTTYGKYLLEKYSGARAIAWGETPRRTHGVPDELQPIAFQHCVVEGIEVTDVIMAGALLQQGIAFQWCGQTQWGLRRDVLGLAIDFAYGSHCMTCTGVRYRNHQPFAFWIANTGHGAHCSGPVGPYPMPDVYAACGSWITADIIDRVLRAGDCNAIIGIHGF